MEARGPAPVPLNVIVSLDIAALELSLSVSVPETDRVFPHLMLEMEFRVSVVECFVISIDAELDVAELYKESLEPSKLAVTDLPVPVVLAAVTETEAVNPPPVVVVPEPALDTAVPE